jgi:hypothetical protein
MCGVWPFSYLIDLTVEGRLSKFCRSQRPRILRHDPYSLAGTLGSWVRIPLEAWMFVCVYSVCIVLCVGSGLATGRSLVQGVLPSVKWSKWKNNLDTVRYKRKDLSKVILRIMYIYSVGNKRSFVDVKVGCRCCYRMCFKGLNIAAIDNSTCVHQ